MKALLTSDPNIILEIEFQSEFSANKSVIILLVCLLLSWIGSLPRIDESRWGNSADELWMGVVVVVTTPAG